MAGLKRVVDGLDRVVGRVARVSQYAAIAILAFMMFLTTADVAKRMVIEPIYGTYELTGLGLSMLIFFGLAHTQRQGEHIAITFIADRWSPRIQAALNVVTYFVLSVMAALLTWQMVVHAQRLMRGGDITLDLRMPVYIFTYFAALGLAIFTLSLVVDFLKSIVKWGESRVQ